MGFNLGNVTINDIKKKVAYNSSRGEYVYDLSNDEIYVIIEDVGIKWLKKNAETIIKTCRSGEWKKIRKKEDIWSWLNNLVCLLPSDYGEE